MQKQKLKLYTNGEILVWQGSQLGWAYWGRIVGGAAVRQRSMLELLGLVKSP